MCVGGPRFHVDTSHAWSVGLVRKANLSRSWPLAPLPLPLRPPAPTGQPAAVRELPTPPAMPEQVSRFRRDDKQTCQAREYGSLDNLAAHVEYGTNATQSTPVTYPTGAGGGGLADPVGHRTARRRRPGVNPAQGGLQLRGCSTRARGNERA